MTKSISIYHRDQDPRFESIVSGCSQQSEECPSRPCEHGNCLETWRGYECDCPDTPYMGKNCDIGKFVCIICVAVYCLRIKSKKKTTFLCYHEYAISHCGLEGNTPVLEHRGFGPRYMQRCNDSDAPKCTKKVNKLFASMSLCDVRMRS